MSGKICFMLCGGGCNTVHYEIGVFRGRALVSTQMCEGLYIIIEWERCVENDHSISVHLCYSYKNKDMLFVTHL